MTKTINRNWLKPRVVAIVIHQLMVLLYWILLLYFFVVFFERQVQINK